MRVLATVLTLGLLLPAYAKQKNCLREDAIKAEMEASSLKNWPEIFSSYNKYWQCDDGAIAEGYSSSIATLLASHWDQFEELSALARKHSAFKKFVLRHIDATMTSDQGNAIRENLRSRCPADAKQLCKQITERLDRLDSKAKRK